MKGFMFVYVVLLGMCTFAAEAEPAASRLFLACREDNDLYRVLTENRLDCSRFDTPSKAVQAAAPGAGVLLLADDYPAKTTVIEPSVWEEAKRKKLRLYVEYPAALPGMEVGTPRTGFWERTVVASDAFGDALAKMRILMIHGCHFLPMEAKQPHLVFARVAGYDTAVYGLPAQNAWPILFEHPNGEILVATTKLSQFITARYAPAEAWPTVWAMVFKWLSPERAQVQLKATPVVKASYAKTEKLPPDAEKLAVKRGIDWFTKGRMLVHETGVPLREDALQRPGVDGTMPGPTADMPIGDGSLGVIEAYSSRIDWQGKQPVRWFARADCCSESAMAFAFHGGLFKDSASKTISANLLDFVTVKSPLQQGLRGNPESPSYGLLGWDTRPQGVTIYYGDDNARALLAMIASVSLLKDERWNEAILRCMLANFRTTGPWGFRNSRIEEPGLQSKGWQWHWHKSTGTEWGCKYSAHYQAYLWAVNLWLYEQTKFEPLLARTEYAMRKMMAAFPDKWIYECGRKRADYARMMLPLAWLLRIHDTPEHREWLRMVAQKVMEGQDLCGAVGEIVTSGERSNEQYGTGESSLVFSEQDKCADLLYTMNFAFLALHEAAAATRDMQMKEAEDRMADFLVRIQSRSARIPELDGVWFRGFDFKKWDYWGSNADIGWGVWSTEVGWTQSWILSVLAMRQKGTSFWELSKNSGIAKNFHRLRQEMLPDDVLRAQPALSLQHDAVKKSVTLKSAPSDNYPGAGAEGLADGLLAGGDHTETEWLGFEGKDLEAVVDLGTATALRRLSIGFLQASSVGIYLPQGVTFEVSVDNVAFHPVKNVEAQPSLAKEEPGRVWLSAEGLDVRARYVRVHAKNFGKIPNNKPGAGRPAWLFADEIAVNPKTNKE